MTVEATFFALLFGVGEYMENIEKKFTFLMVSLLNFLKRYMLVSHAYPTFFQMSFSYVDL